jgi:hypothetical protein
MGEVDAEVNLIAGSEDDIGSDYGQLEYPHEWEYDDLWVGTIEAMEVEDAAAVPEQSGGGNMTGGGGEMEQYESEYENVWVGTVRALEAPEQADGSVGSESDCEESQEEDLPETGTNGLDEQAGGPGAALYELPSPPPGGRPWPPRPKLKPRPGKCLNSQWEQIRREAWTRQLCSDNSSDEDGESYTRFPESRRWMTEIYGFPQQSAATLGGECSA